jgi:hypothetical protein
LLSGYIVSGRGALSASFTPSLTSADAISGSDRPPTPGLAS